MISLVEQCQEQEWGEWIPWAGGECPIPDAKAGEWQRRRRAGGEALGDISAKNSALWDHAIPTGGDITAYRTLRKPTKDVTGDQLWYPPQQEGFSEWREHKPGDPRPVLEGVRSICWLRRCDRDAKTLATGCRGEMWHLLRWTRCDSYDIVAYCIKLDQPAKSEEPAKADSQQEFDNLLDHLSMFKRDREGAAPKRIRPIPPVDREAIAAMVAEMQREDRDEAVALATMVDPAFDHRLGRWGA